MAEVNEQSDNNSNSIKSEKQLRVIDDALHQCAKELQFLAELYRKHGLADHANELSVASENIRNGPNKAADSTEKDRAS